MVEATVVEADFVVVLAAEVDEIVNGSGLRGNRGVASLEEDDIIVFVSFCSANEGNTFPDTEGAIPIGSLSDGRAPESLIV